MDERLSRHDLTDEQWALLAPLMPPHPRQGHRWTDHRLVIDGVFHRTRTGTPWRDLPARFGPVADGLQPASSLVGGRDVGADPDRLLADKAYSSRGSRGGRPVTFDNDAYRLRNTVERTVGKLRGYRAVATRYDKRDHVYRGTVDIAAIGIWLRDPTT